MYFSEGIDTEDSKIGVCFGIAHDVEVDQFLEFHGVGGDIFEYIHEERGDIFAVGHVGDDSSDGLLFLIEIVAIQFLFELPDFSWFSFVSVTHV